MSVTWKIELFATVRNALLLLGAIFLLCHSAEVFLLCSQDYQTSSPHNQHPTKFPFDFTENRKNPHDKSYHKSDFKSHSVAEAHTGFSRIWINFYIMNVTNFYKLMSPLVKSSPEGKNH